MYKLFLTSQIEGSQQIYEHIFLHFFFTFKDISCFISLFEEHHLYLFTLSIKRNT